MARSSLFSHPFFESKDMKRLIRFAMIAAGLVAATVNGYSWGQKGHDITCSIAEQHLTKKAKKQISEIFDGKSIVYWSSWMDNASHTPQYKHTSTWHYKNIDADETYETAQLNPDGDVVRAIEAQIEALKSGKLSKDESFPRTPCRRPALPDAHGTQVGPRRKQMAGPVLRQRQQPPQNLGQRGHRKRPQMDIQ